MSAFGQVTATVHRRPSSSAVLVGLPLLAMLLGAVLALAFGRDASTAPSRPTPAGPPARVTIAAGDLRLALPAGWTRARAGRDVPGFQDARTAHLRARSVDIAVALLAARTSTPSLLPRELADATSPAAAPRVASAGAIRGYHYVRTFEGQRVHVVVVPTTQGIATIACSGATAAGRACDQALGGLRLARRTVVPLSADAAFLARLPAATKTLDDQHLVARERLTQTADVDEASQAAARLAAAYATAVRDLRPLAAPRGGGAATVQLLDRLRSDYDRLAAVVRTGDKGAFAATARAIDGDEARLAARLQAWERVLAGAG